VSRLFGKISFKQNKSVDHIYILGYFPFQFIKIHWSEAGEIWKNCLTLQYKQTYKSNNRMELIFLPRESLFGGA
jgi:hypothetical protein